MNQQEIEWMSGNKIISEMNWIFVSIQKKSHYVAISDCFQGNSLKESPEMSMDSQLGIVAVPNHRIPLISI